MADLIHCITNPISMTLCANAVLSLGAKPIMAEHPLEVKEITGRAQALLLNLGNISETRMESMRISFVTALGKDIPVVIDAVGIGCSKFRRKYLSELLNMLREYDLSKAASAREGLFETKVLIKGNYSEIKALADETYTSKGVDVEGTVTADEVAEISKELSGQLNCWILASGKRDIITDGKKIFLNDSGHEMMSRITGTGCMLGAVCATFLAKGFSISSVTRACTLFGIAGERAYERLSKCCERVGTGSIQMALLDELYFSFEDEQDNSEIGKCPFGKMTDTEK